MNKVNKTNVIFPLRIFETFAGIGAQHKAIRNIDPNGKFFNVVKTSEWDARAVISYAQIHHKEKFNKKLVEIKQWNEEKVDDFFKNKVYSLDSKKPSKITRKNINFKVNLIAATIVNNNLPDIRKVRGKDLHNINLLTYSFPCQGLSIANMGRDLGIKKNSKSTSNLIWEIRRILLEIKSKKQLPKILLMENVKNLIGPKHNKDYQKWISFLNSMGYVTKTFILNGITHGSLQKRKRVFAISVQGWNNIKNNIEFSEWFNKKYEDALSLNIRKEKYNHILNSSKEYKDELLSAQPNKTPSRTRMAKENKDLSNGQKWNWTFNTLTTKQDRHPNIGMIKVPHILQHKNKLDYRFITPREGFLIMGFENKDFNNIKVSWKNKILNTQSLYRQAGNSIVVQKLEKIFMFIKEEMKND